LVDLEGSLQRHAVEYGDGVDWDKYQCDPVPFVAEMLCEHGEWDELTPLEEREEIADRLAEQWAYPVVGHGGGK
jgi:hypothetical protein